MSSEKCPWIVGISASPHNGAVCLLKGDRIVVAIQEERIRRKKRAGVFMSRGSLALQYCMAAAKIAAEDLALVVYSSPNSLRSDAQDIARNPILKGVPSLTISHHHAHALSAFATSGFERSAILVVDGAGSPYEDLTPEERSACKWIVRNGHESVSLLSGCGSHIQQIEKHLVEDGKWVSRDASRRHCMANFGTLGGMYSAVAAQIFGDPLEAGKVMGLAPYGQPTIPSQKFFEIVEGRFVFHDEVPSRYQHRDRWPLREREYRDLARSVQEALEKALLYLVERLYAKFPADSLCYAGGVALNSVANERIMRESSFKNVFIIPAAEDSGPAIGAAYYGLWTMTKENSRRRLNADALGRLYSSQEIQQVIEETPAVEVLDSSDTISHAADLLCNGYILGWYDGRSELGPRALGQRSILCDPRREDAKALLNKRVKHREGFRPFAPAILLEEARNWFELDGVEAESPFMLRVSKIKASRQLSIPAVTHVDGTGRIQTLTPRGNGAFYQLVKKFYERTGVPVVLNTSFNVNGEPIVETPADAVATFLWTEIDYCFMQGQLLRKRRVILFEQNEIPWPQRISVQISLACNVGAMQPAEEGSENPRNLRDYTGVFAHRYQGEIAVSEAAGVLNATFIPGAAVSHLVSGISSALTPCHKNIFEVSTGPFERSKVVFIPDNSDNIVCAAIVTTSDTEPQIFLRRPADQGILPRAIREYKGIYRDQSREMRVFPANEKEIAVKVPGQETFLLLPISPTRFMLKDLPGYAVDFKVSPAGIVRGATVTSPKTHFELRRV